MIDQDMRFDVPMIGVFLRTLRPPGHIAATESVSHLDKMVETFCRISGNQDLNPGEGASPDSFSLFFKPAVAESANRGTERFVLWKRKLHPVRFAAQSASYPAYPGPLRLADILSAVFAPAECNSAGEQAEKSVFRTFLTFSRTSPRSSRRRKGEHEIPYEIKNDFLK